MTLLSPRYRGGFHLTSSTPCWCTDQTRKTHLGIRFYYYANHESSFVIVLYTNMAVLSRDWKPPIISSRLTANKSNCTVVGKSYSLTAFFKFPITEGKYNTREIVNKTYLDCKKNDKKVEVCKPSGETPYKKLSVHTWRTESFCWQEHDSNRIQHHQLQTKISFSAMKQTYQRTKLAVSRIRQLVHSV